MQILKYMCINVQLHTQLYWQWIGQTVDAFQLAPQKKTNY